MKTISNSNRRCFLRWIAGGLASTQILLSGGSRREATADEESAQASANAQPVTKTSWALGAEVSLTAWHPQPKVAAVAIEAAFEELRLVDRLLSLYRNDSQVCVLNRDGVLDNPHRYLVDVLQHAKGMSRRSAGAFDVSVQPLWKLYAEASQQGEVPSPELVENARKTVDWRRIECTAKRIRLRRPKMAITLNGIAQGFAADRVATAFQAHGIRHALINTGEVRALEERPQGGDWSVGIQHPRREDAYISIAGLAGRSLATSGDYATTFSDDYRLHHLFDPRSGRSASQLASVSVAANRAIQADALSTAVFVLGPERGMKLVQATPGADALLVRKDGSALVTDGFPRRTS
jgi:thiamine biosynthesis lipoprotein